MQNNLFLFIQKCQIISVKYEHDLKFFKIDLLKVIFQIVSKRTNYSYTEGDDLIYNLCKTNRKQI